MRQSFLKDFIILLWGRGAGQALTLLVGLILVRVLSDSEFGAYSLATTTIGLAGIIADFGLDTILTREIARETAATHNTDSTLFAQAVFLRIIFAAAITLLFVILSTTNSLLGRPDLLIIGGLSLAPRGILRAAAAIQIGLGNTRRAATMESITAILTSILTVAFILSKNCDTCGAFGAILALLVGNCLALFMVGKIKLSLGKLPFRLLKAAAPFVIVGLAGALFQSLDMYIVRAFYWTPSSAPDSVAIYAAPFRVLNLILLVPTVWGTVALPRYTQYVKNPAVLRSALRRDLLFSLFMGLALGGFCSLFADLLTNIALGSEYAASAPILALLGWMVLPVCLSAPIIAVITAANAQNRIAVCVITGSIALAVANILLASLYPQVGLLGVAALKVIGMCGLLGLYCVAIPWRVLSV